MRLTTATLMLVAVLLGSAGSVLAGNDVSPAICFFFNDPATTEIYTLSLHDALPILGSRFAGGGQQGR